MLSFWQEILLEYRYRMARRALVRAQEHKVKMDEFLSEYKYYLAKTKEIPYENHCSDHLPQ